MQLLRSSLIVSAAALALMGAGCATDNATTITTNANVNSNTTSPANSNTSNVNDTPTSADEDAAGGTSLSGSVDANVNDTPTVDGDATTEIEATVNETKTFDLVASQFAFTPETITVNQGDTVVLNLTTDDVPHGFSLPTFDVNATITPGKTQTVEFVADEAGSFTYTCSVACGAGHSSMRGTLVVN